MKYNDESLNGGEKRDDLIIHPPYNTSTCRYYEK